MSCDEATVAPKDEGFAAAAPVIRARGLGKAYLIFSRPQDRLKQMIFRRRRFFEEYWAFRDVDLDIRRGETIGIIGRNGSGKSTLLQVVAGTLQPTTGAIKVSGRVAPLLELGAGFNPEFTGRENVRLSASILGLEPEEIDERFEAILDFAGIGDFVDQAVKTYSSGMYARLAFAVAAHVDADVFIVDEILSVGDFAFQHKCLTKLEERRAAGATILFVSHDITQVRRICDRVLYMKEGRAAMFGPPRAVCDRYFEDSSGLAASNRPVRSIAFSEPPDGAPDAGAERGPVLSRSEMDRFTEVAAPTRTGPRERAEILCVAINGQIGEPPAIEFADTVKVRVDLAIHEPLPDATVSLYVVDEAGQMIAGSNTRYERLSPGALAREGLHRVTLSLENRFRAGEYGVTIILSEFDPRHKTSYEDYVTLAGRFTSMPAEGMDRWAFYNPTMGVTHEAHALVGDLRDQPATVGGP